MQMINRYIKDTIKGQRWECLIIENEDETFQLRRQHARKDNGKIIKDVTDQITKSQAERYKIENKQYLAETYQY